jgi:lipoprotein-releasing system ATP-binding protein
MTYLLQAKDLHKTFAGPKPVEILQGVSLDLSMGESVAIIGKSGSGKSTLLHILGTLDTPSSGSVTISGKDAFSNTAKLRRDSLGFVFQSFHLLEDYTLLENILMPASITRKNIAPGSASYLHAQELIEFIGLSDRAKTPVKFLSGGEKQRVAIARAFCNNPDLLFVDEPTGNLDPINAKIVQDLSMEGCKKQGKSLILVTHDEEFAFFCDRVFMLKEGHLVPKKSFSS